MDSGDGHAMVPSVLCDEVRHAVDAAAPQRLVLVEQAARQAQPVHVGPDDLAAAGALLGDQARPLEHRDVLLHGREAHGVVPGQFSDPFAAAQRAQDDVTTRAIGECGEDLVGVEGELH